MPYPVAGFVSYCAGILNGYTWNRRWTFGTGAFDHRELARYTGVQTTAALANAGGLAVAVEVLGIPKLPAEVVVLAPIVVVTFLVNRSWTFRARG